MLQDNWVRLDLRANVAWTDAIRSEPKAHVGPVEHEANLDRKEVQVNEDDLNDSCVPTIFRQGRWSRGARSQGWTRWTRAAGTTGTSGKFLGVA